MFLQAPVCRPSASLDRTPVAFAVPGHSTWPDILSRTSAMNLAELSHSKAPLWSRQQRGDCFPLRHTLARTHTHTQTERTKVHTHSPSFKWVFCCLSLLFSQRTHTHTRSPPVFLYRTNNVISEVSLDSCSPSFLALSESQARRCSLGHYTL